ncbi:prolyl oligopeptidase family serine peptidase [Massilia sp. IC2-477]|uniref:alpha/beta hydrolase family protein n=1 Tax=Massilia sp. IC2-477 TaxID=2887198 RepID=UPI001D0F94CD|nr:prolyl oligopeptidase family serine peptidase [Massilia sp. IC2-477]MCC2956938.1 prolyl oligopeptidase family serine peptidase [Massilia sp. IC2-477]
MTSVFFRLAFAAVLACSLPVQAQAPASTASARPPIASFFANSPFGGASLSPDARFLAVRSGAPGKRDFLAVVNLQDNSVKVVASYDDADVGEFRWISNERLVFNTREKGVGVGNRRYAPGLYAVNRDGEKFVELADRVGSVHRTGTRVGRKILPWHTYLLDQPGPRNSDTIYVESYNFDTSGEVRSVDLLRLNTLTGFTQSVPRPGNVTGWMLDHQGEPRLASSFEKDTITLHYRDPASGAWRMLTSYPAYGDGSRALQPLGFAPDGKLYVLARSGGRDTTALHLFDVASGRIDPQPLVVTAGFDFDGSLVTNRDKVLGIRFTTDAESNEWFDPAMKTVQAAVDKLLPATINLITVPAQVDSPVVLVRSYSDTIPGTWSLYNIQTGAISKIADLRPGINPAQMGRQQFIRYKARDGLEIPALLTLPAGGAKTKLPMVVLVHGGPFVRGGSWGWNRETQFVASRGYAVLEPEFRGSTGFGTKHFKAGFKQWGLAMQDDLADGVRWAVGKGIADGARVCIAGASYGGYATLMGLVKDPELYKCGINWVGVTDINLLYNGGWNFSNDTSDEYKAYGMPEMIGDPVKDAAQFKATSPLAQAARITQPVLLAYGGADRRVPVNHGTAFRDALQKTNKNVEWVEYPEEGHGWSLEKNNFDFWGRVERFLDRHIGAGAAKQ